MAKASSLSLKVLTPIAEAAVSSSRIATQARPTRLRLARTKMNITKRHQQQRQEVVVGEVRHLGAEDGLVLAEVDAEEVQVRHAVDALRPVGQVRSGGAVEVVDGDPEDLAEAQRHDGQVVAAQPQRRGTDDQAEDRGHDPAADEDGQERLVVAGERRSTRHRRTAPRSRRRRR